MNEKTRELVWVSDSTDFIKQLDAKKDTLTTLLKIPEDKLLLLGRLNKALEDPILTEELKKIAEAIKTKMEINETTGGTDLAFLVSLFKTIKGAAAAGADMMEDIVWEGEKQAVALKDYKFVLKNASLYGKNYIQLNDPKNKWAFQGLFFIKESNKTEALGEKTKEVSKQLGKEISEIPPSQIIALGRDASDMDALKKELTLIGDTTNPSEEKISFKSAQLLGDLVEKGFIKKGKVSLFPQNPDSYLSVWNTPKPNTRSRYF